MERPVNNEENGKQTAAKAGSAFRLSYILFPLVFLALSAVMAAWFYHLLPAEVVWRFSTEGAAESTAGRGAVVAWGLAIQLVLTLVAAGLSGALTALFVTSGRTAGSRLDPVSIIRLMGNMVALIHAVVFFALLDIFSYNAYGAHLLPLWAIVLIVMGGGAVILSIFFFRALLRVWAANKE